MNNQSNNIFTSFASSLVAFPKHLIECTVGLIIAIMTDVNVTVIAATGVAVGFALDNVVKGVAAFFLIYTISRIVSLIANSIGYGFSNLAQADASIGHRIASVFDRASEELESRKRS